MSKLVRAGLFLWMTLACWGGCYSIGGATSASSAGDQIAVERYKADRAAELQRQEARDALTETIVDKGFLAVIVAMVGFVITRALDRYQSQLAADSKIESQRFSHLDEVWTLLHQCEHIKQEVGSLVRRGVRWQKSRELLADYDDGFQEKAAEARQKAEETFHWLGPKVYRELIEYHNTLSSLFAAYMREDLAKASKLERELERQRHYISDPRRLGAKRWSVRIG